MSDQKFADKILPIDLGFGWTKAKYKGREFRQPSVIGEVRQLHEENYRPNDYEYGHMNLKDQTKFDAKYFVGNLAVRHSDIRYFSINDEKVGNITTDILISTALAELAPAEELYVVTGLPLDFYFKQRNSLEGFLGLYNIKKPDYIIRRGGDNETLVHNQPNIVKQTVTMQPMGSAMNYLLDDNGNFKDKSEAGKLIVVGDIGFHTFDLLVLDGMEIHRFSHSNTDISVANSYRMIQEYLKHEVGKTPDISQLDACILKGEYEGLDLMPIIEATFESISTQITLAVDSLNLNYHKFISTGGWSSLITPKLDLDANKIVQYGQDGNIDGYAKIGARICQS